MYLLSNRACKEFLSSVRLDNCALRTAFSFSRNPALRATLSSLCFLWSRDFLAVKRFFVLFLEMCVDLVQNLPLTCQIVSSATLEVPVVFLVVGDRLLLASWTPGHVLGQRLGQQRRCTIACDKTIIQHDDGRKLTLAATNQKTQNPLF